MTGKDDTARMDILRKYNSDIDAPHNWTIRCNSNSYYTVTRPLTLKELSACLLNNEYLIVPSETGRLVIIPTSRIDIIMYE